MTQTVLTGFRAKSLTISGFLIGLVSYIAVSEPARAISINLVPSIQTIEVGDSLTLDMAITGLGSNSAPSVSTFDFNLGFDASVLDFTSLDFGDPVLGNLVDISGVAQEFTDLGIFDAVGFSEPSQGTVNLFEVSLELPQDLDLSQPDSFILATLDFVALDAGTSDFDLMVNALGDSFGDPLTLDAIESLPVLVADASSNPPSESIPEPTTSIFGFLSLFSLGRWVSKKGLAA